MRSLIRSAFPFGPNQPEFTEVSDGDEAVAAYRAQRFDIVLLDVKMPGVDGLEALEAIRAYDEGAFVVMISGELNGETIQRAKNAGAISLIRKPMSHKVGTDILETYRTRRLRPVSVLAADESTDIIAALTAGLGILKIEHRMYRAETVAEALRAFETIHFDLLFIDNQLSGTDTLKLISYIKSARPSTYLVVFTDDSSIESVLKARTQGADDYLLKSVDLIQLAKVWNRFLNTTKSETITGRRPIPAS